MTNKERLISLLGFAPSQDSVEGALLDYGIEGAETYNGSNIKEIKTAAIGVLCRETLFWVKLFMFG